MQRGLSLANKCQLLFGAAVLAILASASAVPWLRVERIVTEGQMEVARQLAESWVANGFALRRSEGIPIPMRVETVSQLEERPDRDPFVMEALRRFQENPDREEAFQAREKGGETVYTYVRALRERQWRAIQDRRFVDFSPRASETGLDDPLRAVLVIERTSPMAAAQVAANRTAIAVGALGTLVLAMVVFHLVLTKLIYSPVRRLRRAAERVEQGDTTVRSGIITGDEFEELSRAFDGMLERLTRTQAQLQAMNQSLDLKVVELSEANVGLFESNTLKSEFLANVSHELRTPLNSIIGFAELLDEMARNDPQADPKRRRYIGNILSSGRMLLDMINELLAMAKIEAGRVEVQFAPASIRDVAEGLQAIMRPQAHAKSMEIEVAVEPDLPPVETDAGKLQQILYNFVSNAVKFAPSGSTIRIECRMVRDASRAEAVRVSVVDQGPGVPLDMQDSIFEKFRQLDASHTRQHSGTGLGLAICRELAEMLGGRLQLVSAPGKGATFSIELPVVHVARQLPPLLGAAAARRQT